MKPLAADDPHTIGEYRLQGRLGQGGMAGCTWGYPLADEPSPSRSCTPNSPGTPNS
jgi:hypothetical protein